MLIILVVIYYIFLRYSPEQIITYSGYMVEGNEMVENLKSNDKPKVMPYLGLIAVQENDLIYKRLNSYYIGEDDKKEIDINYPIYIKEGNALLNIGPNTKLITVNYEEVEGYPDFMMTDGVMYNGIDLTRADGNKYLFLKSEDEIYTNVEPITITTSNGEYNIKEYSNIYFAEDYIAYYEMEGIRSSNEEDEKNNSDNNNQGNNQSNSQSTDKINSNNNDNLKDSYLQYKMITPIDQDSKTRINGETLTYKIFLERIGVLQTEENNGNNNEAENTVENETKAEAEETEPEQEPENTIEAELNNNGNGNSINQNIINTENNQNDDDQEEEWQEGMWEKPEVTCTDFESDVYTITTNLTVRDRAGVITRGITFELYLEGILNRRILATQAGNIEITNLQPSSEYEIRGIFYYNDENGVEQEEEFYNGTVTTKSIDTLGTIDFSFQNGEIYSNKIELKNLKVNNDINEEVIKGISRVQVEIGEITYRLSNDQVNELKEGKEITYQTGESLNSNSKIKYKITAFDRFGNELKEQNNEGETITSKQVPTASIRATKQDVTEIELEVTLTNKDNVKLENYRYEITNQSGEVIKQGLLGNNESSDNGSGSSGGNSSDENSSNDIGGNSSITGGNINDGHKETLKFNDIDPNGYYQIIIYGDYDLENGTGIQQNAELGRASFVTRPLASLGYMQVRIDDKEITQNSMHLGIRIDENQTDARLLAILDKVEVVIYDQGKNVENGENNSDDDGNNDANNQESQNNNDSQSNNNSDNQSDPNNQQTQANQQETEVQRITLTTDQVQQLKTAEEVELVLEQLNSNTKYRIDVITTVKQGTVEQIVEDKQNLDQLITLKMPAEVQVRNQFVIGTMIDLDIRVEDIDNAVLTNNVRIEVRDKDNKLIDLSEMPTNAEYERKVYEDLTPNEEYRIIVYAPQYNIGSTDATYEADYILKEIKIVTETGISGRLDLIGLEKAPTGKNLIDVSSKVNWYEKCFNTGSNYGLNYDENTKILTLGGFTSYNNRNYYDLSKYLGQEITISFKARKQGNTNMTIIEKNNDNFNDTNFTTYYTISNLNNDWQEYSYTVTLSKTGYIGFLVTTDNVSVEIQDLQIELGSRKTDYEEFRYDYNANVTVTVNDERNEITTNDYYIRIYKNNEQIQEHRYEEIGEENKVENAQKTYNIEPDANYRIELLVKIADRFYELDSQEFSTEGSRELKGIFNINDFLKIQPYGEYIVLNDLDFSGSTEGRVRYIMRFNGKINFNGKSVTKDWRTGTSTIFYMIGEEGIIENLVFDIKMNFTNTSTGGDSYAGLTYQNDGIIRNIQINLLDSNYNENINAWLFCYRNNNLIENFVVNFKSPFYTYTSGSVFGFRNYGTIRNGYIYGEDIELVNNNSVGASRALVYQNRYNGVVENIFTLVGFDANSKRNAGVLVSENLENATVQNVYSVDVGENINLSYGPTIGLNNSKVYNAYYFEDEVFTSGTEIKGNKLSLWDAQFQNQLINTTGAFIVDELVNEGYYPHLNMPDCMPAQEFIELPEVADADLPDILSTKVLEQGTDTVKVEFSVNNPTSETISEIQIANLDVEIISQEYSNGKSTVIANLKNPDICVSSYDVISLTTSGAFGSGYTRTYNSGERVINVDLYKEIWNINDWKEINNSPTENYMLMEDLNFVNEGNTINLGTVNGIINGNGHNISNIYLTNNNFLIKYLRGSVQNLFINNFNQETTANGGIIDTMYSGSMVNQLHLTDVKISKDSSGYIGGVVGYASGCSVRNSSANNLSINVKEVGDYVRLGGLVGSASSLTMENCFTNGISINCVRAIDAGIGGVVGYGTGSNSIKNCYSEGTIQSDNLNIGGIIGNEVISVIENCYSKVDISTIDVNIGGIVGLDTDNDITEIANNLSVGNIYTTSGLDTINRIVGNNVNTQANNYAYKNQLLNGYTSEEEKGATLLTIDEILNLDLGNSYNYDRKEENIMPKLYNTEGTELLPNQSDIYIEENDNESVKIEVENIEAVKPNTTEAEVTIRINNPEEIEITGIEIEDMQVTSIVRNVTQNGITSITVRATPIRYYDSYKLTGIKYKKEIEEEQTKEVENEIPVQFYKEIYTYEDWQSIEEGTYQNYRLMANIDFSGRTNIKNNITVNRLEAENNIYTLKNIELSYNAANTGLINNVKTSLKNIKFENITIENTINGSYCGIIATNNADIENVSFSNVTIGAEKMNYVGLIGSFSNGSAKNILMDTIYIYGVSYVGGLTGQCDYPLTDVSANNVNISASGSYCGGILGISTGMQGNSIRQSNVKVENSSVSGVSYVGGISGRCFETVLSNSSTISSSIRGTSYIGGVCGYKNMPSLTHCYNNMVDDCEIYGNGYNIGGISGENRCYDEKSVVRNSKIIGTNVNGYNVGGIAGNSPFRLWYCTVENSEINSLGRNVGGIAGSAGYGNSQHAPLISFVKDCIIKGNNTVGGIAGRIEDGYIPSSLVNAEIVATQHTAGGIVGMMDVTYMTANAKVMQIYRCGTVQSSITAPTKVGGLVGDITKDLIGTGFFYNNYIDAKLNCDDEENVSMGIGGSKENNEKITNTHIYKYGQINGEYINENIDTYKENQYVDGNDLRQETTYRTTFGWGSNFSYASLRNNKYPIPAGVLETEGVDLPVDPEVAEINTLSIDNENGDNANEPSLQNSLANGNSIENANETETQTATELPTYKIYPVSVNEINVDFSLGANTGGTNATDLNNARNSNNVGASNTNSTGKNNTTFTYYVNGEPKETIELSNNSKQTYTFKYNFKDTIEIKLINESDLSQNNVAENNQANSDFSEAKNTTKTDTATEATITITPDMVRSTASLVGENYAYLNGTDLYDNGKIRTGEYVNIYEGLALNSDGTVINIATNEIVEQDITTALEIALENTLENKDATIPLETYNYKDYVINTYGTYSTVNGKIKNQIYNVRNGKLSALSNSLDMKIGNSIIDNYNNKEYQTILSSNGELVDLKEMLQYPDNFLNQNIKQIAQNTNEEKPEVMVLYETGKVIVFNYVTGEVVYENNEKANNGIADYIEGSVSKIWSDYENKQAEYEKGKELAEKLEQMPIEEAMKQLENGNNQDTQEETTATNTISNTESENSINNDSYITVYDGNTEEYDVYSENEILGGEEEEPVSETTKIKQNGLEKVYSYDAREEATPQTNGAMIVVAIIAVAVIALVILRKIVVKNNTKKKK